MATKEKRMKGNPIHGTQRTILMRSVLGIAISVGYGLSGIRRWNGDGISLSQLIMIYEIGATSSGTKHGC